MAVCRLGIRIAIYGRELARQYPEVMTLVADPGPSNTWIVTSLGWVDKIIVYLGNYNKFLDDDQGHWSQVWLVGVFKERVNPGELHEPVEIPSNSCMPYCLNGKLAAGLWEWT